MIGHQESERFSIKAGEIIAPRCWLYFRGMLTSMSVPYLWHPGVVNEAGITSPDSEGFCREHTNFHFYDTFEPEPEGFYAFKSLPYAVTEYSYVNEEVAFGTVALWGTVLEHEHGYRAQYAKIHSLEFITHMPKGLPIDDSFDFRLPPLKEKYGVA